MGKTHESVSCEGVGKRTPFPPMTGSGSHLPQQGHGGRHVLPVVSHVDASLARFVVERLDLVTLGCEAQEAALPQPICDATSCQ